MLPATATANSSSSASVPEDLCPHSFRPLTWCRFCLPYLTFSRNCSVKQETNPETDEKMFRKPSSQLHLPLLALLVFALILSIATLACAATTLNLFNSQQSTNPWLLPLWRSHFDLRGLKLVVGTSVAIALFDSVAIVVMSLLAVQVTPLSSPFVRRSVDHEE